MVARVATIATAAQPIETERKTMPWDEESMPWDEESVPPDPIWETCRCAPCQAVRALAHSQSITEVQDALHETCERCDSPCTDELRTIRDGYVCGDCLSFHRRCSECGRHDRRAWCVCPTDVWSPNQVFCRECTSAFLNQCNGCDNYFLRALTHSYCSDCANDDCGCANCYDNRDQETLSELTHSYSYRPRFNFHGGGPVWLGLELEISTPYGDVEAARACIDALGSLGYLKEDSSVDGFELVTHPMSHTYARRYFPWELLTELDNLGCNAWGNGIHVHVSRTAFDSPSHTYRWLRFIYRNSDAVTAIARRNSDQWASFRPPPAAEVYDYVTDRFHTRKPFIEFAKGAKDGDRYSAVNVQNDATFEVRVFRSSLDEQEVMAALDLVAASVEYTRHLTVPAIVKDGGWSWAGFIKWASAVEGNPYAALIAENRKVSA